MQVNKHYNNLIKKIIDLILLNNHYYIYSYYIYIIILKDAIYYIYNQFETTFL